ncbi:glycosyltransferase [Cohnella thailandensis]|uniref:Glycosyltransferase family 4 protein n=1 Tax=Cohnella thailandensis TaxID=557557 RepID=A0A841T148_9BACL|nr:glycosyltransferase family 4 protein [Cohnella thailandensis]MBP1971930.1 glycosyltransferase involved in cell wall biosynthesis [Cohnella thailandensis]
MRIAIIHDWLVVNAGAEKVLEQLVNLYPNADLFSTVDFLKDSERGFIQNKRAKTTFIQKLPFARKKYRSYLPFMPLAIEQLDLRGYDLVISSSHAVAKGVLTSPGQVHISYVHTPIRYAWDMQQQYLEQTNLIKGFKSSIARIILHYIRMWDLRTVNSVDAFIANSQFVSNRIRKYYGRHSDVIYPPVDVSAFEMKAQKEDFYLIVSRLVPYKKMDLIVRAFATMPDKKLIIIGDGPERDKVKAHLGPNTKYLGRQSFEVLKDHMQRARAIIFAAEEDFGIVPVEAQACGTPVIAYGKGGVLETVIGEESENPTGLFFNEQTVESIREAVERFEARMHLFKPENCRSNATRFTAEQFRSQFSEFVITVLNKTQR